MVYGIILAAGYGTRMKTKERKQFMKINGKEIINYSIDKFLSIKNISTIIIVINEQDKNTTAVKNIISKYKNEIYNEKLCFILGGDERYDSVYSALNFIYDNYYIKKDDKVLIHDSARPNVDIKDIKKLITILKKYKVVTLGTKLTDTIKEINNKKVLNKNIKNKNSKKEIKLNKNSDIVSVIKTVDRNNYYLISTPQGFNLRLLIDSYDKFYAKLYNNKTTKKNAITKSKYNKLKKSTKNKLNITDDLQIIENFSKEKAYILDSNKLNYKITTKDDINLLKYLL